MTSYARVNDWAGVRVGARHPLPTAILSTRNPTHQSAVVGAALRNPLVPTLRLDSTDSLGRLIEQLNAFRPRLLVCYASMLMPLVEAQREGHLRINPEKVITASEEQSPGARRTAIDTWGVDVVNTYAATETATIASTCPSGSLHLCEDFLVVEPVDHEYGAVADGELSDRVLVRVLFSRTLPLIRYELTDSVRLSTTGCECGLRFRRLESVAGRTEDTLELPGASGQPVRVRPDVFHNAL